MIVAGPARGASGLHRYAAALLATSCLCLPRMGSAQVVGADASVTVYNAPNGVPVVDIAAANGAGVSHNRYSQFDVDSRGLVLNNGAPGGGASNASQLAGQVPANTHLNGAASLILNEVTSTQRSNLAGYVEVTGTRADVVIANPNGITCGGCGFINTPNVTLSTGSPVFGGSGALAALKVTGGDILITGSGLNASAQDYLALVARKVKIDGQVNAKTLDLVGGSETWNVASRTSTPLAGDANTPDYAIDSTAVGGIYAGRIRLIANEQGVGVRTLGEAAASADDFTIDAAGKVIIGGKASAERDLAITTVANASDAVTLTGAQVSAKRDVAVADTGGAVLTGGVVTAGRNLNLTAATLTDTATGAAVTDNNKRYGGTAINVSVSGAATTSGTAYGAGGALSITTGTLTATGTALFGGSIGVTTTSGALDLADSAAKTAGDVALNAATTFNTGSGGSQGVQSTGGAVTITANGGFANAGTISADAGAVTIRASGSAVNTGSVHGGASLDVMDAAFGFSESFTNKGTWISDGTLLFRTAAFSNSGTVQSATNATLGATSISNTGTIILGAKTSAQAVVGGGPITNSGILQGGGDLDVASSGALSNQATGKILAAGGLSIHNMAGGQITLSNANLIQAGGFLQISGGTGGMDIATTSAAVFLGGTVSISGRNITLADGASMTGKGSLALFANTLTVAGPGASIVAADAGSGTGTISVATALTNPGFLYSKDVLTISAPGITNTATGAIASGGTLNLNATGGDVTNAGALFANTALNLTATGTFLNTDIGTVDVAKDASFTSDTFKNFNNVHVGGSLTIDANTFLNEPYTGDTRYWNYAGTGFDPTSAGSRTAAGGEGGGTSATEGYGAVRDGTYEDNCNIFGFACDQHENWHSAWHTEQFYTIAPTHNPQLIANTILTIKNFTSALNLGGVISAPTVNITSTKPGATFTNDDYSLTTQQWYATWNDFQPCTTFGGCGSWDLYRSYTKSITSSSYVGIGAGVYAGALNVNGTALVNVNGLGTVNVGAPTPTTANAKSKAGAAAGQGAGAISFGGLNLNLPSSPNGFFVVNKNPTTGPLIETNPRFNSPESPVSSDYLLAHLGVDPDTTQRRLGDANFENYLVTQQIVAQTGAAILARGETEDQQYARLMDQAVQQASALGLVVGRAPTADQLANLKEDIVWMVEVEVAGQKVLAPKVYLAPTTLAMITGGAVIAADNANLNVTSLTNTGGTIQGSKTLNITSQGDVTNTSGTIKGGDVSITSTEGSIVNKTYNNTMGGQSTDMGQTASIQSTGALDLNAKKDIVNQGANVSAGGDASLSAGGDVTFESIETSTTTQKARTKEVQLPGGGLFGAPGGPTTVTVNEGTQVDKTTTQVGSNLTTGGGLKINAGKDVNFAASSAKTGGDAEINAGGDINVTARQNTTSTEIHQGSGGFLSSSSHDETHTTSTNAGSDLQFGGNLKTNSGGDTNIVGSQVSTGGNADIVTGGDLNVLAGRNSKTDVVKDTSSGIGKNGGIYGSTTETDKLGQSRSVASGLNVGGNLTTDVAKTLTIQGSNVQSGGDTTINAQDVNILAGQNVDTHEHTVTETKLGLFIGSDAAASAQGGASAKGGGKSAGASGQASNSTADGKNADSQSGTGGGGSKGALAASASGGASAQGELDIDLMRSKTTTDRSLDVVNVGSNLGAGGNLTINAGNKVRAVGSNLSAGGDATINAQSQSFEAAQDIHETSHSEEKTSAGLFLSGSAGAEGQASGSGSAGSGAPGVAGGGQTPTGGASGEATAEVGAGLRVAHSTAEVTEGSTTAVTSTITAGGNVNRNAAGNITDVGTQIQAGGDFNQKAGSYDSKAAADTTYSSASSTNMVGKTGVYADAGAGADTAKGGGDADASAGGKSSFTRDASKEGSNSSSAVVTNITAGGNVNSVTTGKTTLEGTNLTATAGDINLTASSVDFQAARNTETNTSSADSESVEGKAGVSATKAVKAELSVGLSNETANDNSSEAVTGSVNAGGNFNIKTTQGDVRLEGTNLNAGGEGNINAAGNVVMDAARNTSSSSSASNSLDVTLSTEKSSGGGGKGAEVGVGIERSQSQSSEAVVGSVTTGGGLNINAGKNATFEGTALQSGGDTNVSAGGDVSFNAAKSTDSESSFSLEVSVGVDKSHEGGKGETTKGGKIGLDVSASSETQAQGATVQSGGALNITSGRDVNLEGTQIGAQGAAAIDAGRDVNVTSAVSSSSSSGFGLSAQGETTSESGGGKEGKPAGGKDDKPPPPPPSENVNDSENEGGPASKGVNGKPSGATGKNGVDSGGTGQVAKPGGDSDAGPENPEKPVAGEAGAGKEGEKKEEEPEGPKKAGMGEIHFGSDSSSSSQATTITGGSVSITAGGNKNVGGGTQVKQTGTSAGQ